MTKVAAKRSAALAAAGAASRFPFAINELVVAGILFISSGDERSG
jgi:hypothetical protein